MAQEISYFEDNVTFTEGPFVICNPLGNGWRIEAEIKGHRCPALPDITIYYLCKAAGLPLETSDRREHAVKICDWLNQQVRDGRVVLVDGSWRAFEIGGVRV